MMAMVTISAAMIQIGGLYFFVVGFFPVKPALSGISGLESFHRPGSYSTDDFGSSLPPEKLKSLYQESSGIPPYFDRLILMVIDGLPAEFVLGKDEQPPPSFFKEAMPFTQSLLTKGVAIGYHARAAPPTVTMPRLKSMVSGAIGGFLDVATNFNTQAFLDDNLIAQFLKIGWKMVMLGDDTWLKLFPDMFHRHDGVSSFFVKDTVQVDHNVSRHLIKELRCNDWDLLILHYLGLDHVGHIGGRKSIMMGPKLTEMDEVIKTIYKEMESTVQSDRRGTLLLIVSDHGMTETGNHGGSSYEETDALALFVGTKEFRGASSMWKEILQVDLAPTLALLFGVPIPLNSVGTVITGVFPPMQGEEELRILELNSWQLLRLLKSHMTKSDCGTFSCDFVSGKPEIAEKLCCLYLDAAALHEFLKSRDPSRRSSNISISGDEYRDTVLAYRNFLEAASKWLSSRSTEKPIGMLAFGLAAMVLSCLAFVKLLLVLHREVDFKRNEQLSSKRWPLDDCFAVAVVLIHVLSMGSSSMIEEEQYLWHYLTSTLGLIFLKRTFVKDEDDDSDHPESASERRRAASRSVCYIVAVLILGRLLRGWHRGGVNWSYMPDISKLLKQAGCAYVKPLHLSALFVVVLCCALFMATRLKRSAGSLLMLLIFTFPISLVAKQIWKNVEEGMLVSSGFDANSSVIQITYGLLGISTLGILVLTPWSIPPKKPEFSRGGGVYFFDSFVDSMHIIGFFYVLSWSILQMLLQQPVNSIPMSLIVAQMLATVCHFAEGGGLNIKQWVKVATLYYLGMAGHFGLGNTNTLATIDVAGAFIGVSSHSTTVSGILMFCITYASPMVSLLTVPMILSSSSMKKEEEKNDHLVESTTDVLKKRLLVYPCLVPVAINSVVLVAYTAVLIAMRNHLFVWSVFSPKYLYVCASTACVYAGAAIVAASATYSYAVVAMRSR
ncbi:hypothetical protein M569_07175, partial [Genlisea aurea]